jgi:Cupin-like domain
MRQEARPIELLSILPAEQQPSHADCSSRRLLEFDQNRLATYFNRKPFGLRHHLRDESLLQLDKIRELAGRLETRPGELYGDIDVTRVDQRWDQSARPVMSFESLVGEIASTNAWIIIRHAELDPRYRSLLDNGMKEIKEAGAGCLPSEIRKENAIIFVTSPHRISTYHIDRECNFILQIRGDKHIYIFDQNDRDVLPEEELERFWAFDNNAATYKPQYQDRCQVFHLRPGDGVHVPVNAPHWVQNGDEISITLSLNFQFNDMERANRYRANYYIRRLGITPAPPGKHPMRDSIKANAVRGAVRLGKPLKALLGG